MTIPFSAVQIDMKDLAVQSLIESMGSAIDAVEQAGCGAGCGSACGSCSACGCGSLGGCGAGGCANDPNYGGGSGQ